MTIKARPREHRKHSLRKRITIALTALTIVVLAYIEIPAQSPADFDGNGKVEFSDFVLFATAFGTSNAQFDLDSNGSVDFPTS